MARPRKKADPHADIDYDEQARKNIAEFEEFQRSMSEDFTAEQRNQIAASMTDEERTTWMAQLKASEEIYRAAKARMSFREFVKFMRPEYRNGRHFEILANAFERIIAGEEVKLIINIAPRRGKSEYTSILFPAFLMGRRHGKKTLHITNVRALASDFGGKIRNMMEEDPYKRAFPEITLAKDKQAKDSWRTNRGGEYFAAGVGSTVFGRGGDLFIVDDPHKESESQTGSLEPPSKEDYEAAWNWWMTVRSRLQPGGSILIVMQRWSNHDLTGRLVAASKRNPQGDQWEVITMPALEEYTEHGEQKWRSTWPEFWPTDKVIQLRETMMSEANGAWRWHAMYQQEPGADAQSTFKREYWRAWEGKPPAYDFIIQSWDMAATSGSKSNYTAMTMWGVFNRPDNMGRPVANLMLIDAYRARLEFPDARRVVKEKYSIKSKDSHGRDAVTHPDCLIIEYKSAGIGIVQELRRAGIPVSDVAPSANQWGARNDKHARGQRVLEILSSGLVWYQEGSVKAMEVIEECAAFPNGEYDDYYDTVVQALQRFRDGGFIRLDNDDWEEEVESTPQKATYYNLG